MVDPLVPATATVVLVTAALPLFLQGVRVIVLAETVTWNVLTRHLKWIGGALVLTTVPILVWMLPRFGDRVLARRLLFLHAFLGVQAYALLLVGLTGIYRIVQVKRRADGYRDPDPDQDIDELHPDMGAWRGRLRFGVIGFMFLWFLTYVAGAYRYYVVYWSS